MGGLQRHQNGGHDQHQVSRHICGSHELSSLSTSANILYVCSMLIYVKSICSVQYICIRTYVYICEVEFGVNLCVCTCVGLRELLIWNTFVTWHNWKVRKWKKS